MITSISSVSCWNISSSLCLPVMLSLSSSSAGVLLVEVLDRAIELELQEVVD